MVWKNVSPTRFKYGYFLGICVKHVRVGELSWFQSMMMNGLFTCQKEMHCSTFHSHSRKVIMFLSHIINVRIIIHI